MFNIQWVVFAELKLEMRYFYLFLPSGNTTKALFAIPFFRLMCLDQTRPNYYKNTTMVSSAQA